MTVVLVHGVPENALVWEPLQRELGSPSVAVTLPGVGGAAPVGWSGSKEALLAWLDAELAGFEPPLDVVAHDLGALLVMRLAVAGRTRLRSWVVDVPDLFAPDARFSPFAIALQQADDPLAVLKDRSRHPPDSAASWAGTLRSAGIPSDLAERIASTHTSETDAAIAAFYRSADPNVAVDWWPSTVMSAQGAGLVLLLPDPPPIEQRSRHVATRLGAATADLTSTHAWMAHSPTDTARVLTRFWAQVA